MGKIKFEKDNILPKKMIIAVWDSKSNSAVYTIWLDPGAIIGVGDRKRGVRNSQMFYFKSKLHYRQGRVSRKNIIFKVFLGNSAARRCFTLVKLYLS